ncbi:hypothetical protein Hanom_Chr16g01445811 [Helianthus anomalus]
MLIIEMIVSVVIEAFCFFNYYYSAIIITSRGDEIYKLKLGLILLLILLNKKLTNWAY